ncbi:MAG: hypothetical protein OXS29_04235 [bacterium]|nr:hypothetical protein [bacterium]MDE0290634.1 hypothetical protein [bacterium]MDE0439086.1 hypothetical protein [bacterium]
MPKPRPEDIRAAMADYVGNVHAAYARVAFTYPPAVQGGLELLASPFTVVAAGARNLHVIATGERLAAPRGPEVSADFEQDGMVWTLRFLDPVVLPALGTAESGEQPDPRSVRRAVGIGRYHYHLVVRPGSDLTAHHATHAGTGLANAHLAAARDYESIRAHASGNPGLVDELAAADAAGLTRAHGLLACALVPWSEGVKESLASGDRKRVRRAVVAALRGPG